MRTRCGIISSKSIRKRLAAGLRLNALPDSLCRERDDTEGAGKRRDGMESEGRGQEGKKGNGDRESTRNGADRGVEKGRKVGGEGRKGRSGQVLVMNRTAYRYIPFNLPTLPTAVQQMIGVSGPILQDSLNTKMGNTVVQTDT